MIIFVSVYSILKSYCKYKSKSIFDDVKRISIPQDSHKDLNFKSKYKCKSSRC